MRTVPAWSIVVALMAGCGGATSAPISAADASVDATPDSADCANGVACCHGTLDCGDAGSDASDIHDASDSKCPPSAPIQGAACNSTAQSCVYNPDCPAGTGAFRQLSFSCKNGTWNDALGPGPACEGPAPQDGGPSPSHDCTSSGGTVVTQECCTSNGDFPSMCGLGACSCAPSSSHTIQACQCGAGDCFDGKSCVPFGG